MDLPDTLLLEMMCHWPPAIICTLGSVNQRLRCLSHDKTLWVSIYVNQNSGSVTKALRQYLIYHCEELRVVSFLGCFTPYVKALLNVPLHRLVYLIGIDVSGCNLLTSVSFICFMPHLKDVPLDRLHYVPAVHFRLCLTEAHHTV